MTWVRRGWVVPLAALAVAACTGGGGGPAGPAPAATSAAPLPAPASTITWTDCRLPAAPGAVVRSVAAGGEGVPWIAVGQEGGGSAEVRPAAWTAPDGCAWRRAAVTPVTPDGERTGFSAVARRGRTVVALGRAYSRIHGSLRPTLWRAAAGAPLREVELPRELFGGESGITVDALVAGSDAFLATGAYIAPDHNVAVHVWRGTDGLDWVRLPPDRAQTSTPADQLLPRDLAAGPAGSLVVGTSFRVTGGNGFDGAAWYAPSAARQWQRADLTAAGLAGPGDQRLTADAAVGSGYVVLAAVGAGTGVQLRSAVSPDGLSWSAGGPLPGPPLPAGRTVAHVAPEPGGGAVAGTTAGGRPALWVSADGRSWAPETVPGPAGPATDLVLGPGPDRLVLVVQTKDGPRMHLGRPTR